MWFWLEKSKVHIYFFILYQFIQILSCWYGGSLAEYLTCWISNSQPLLAHIFSILRALILASVLHKLLMMTDCFLYYAIRFIYFLCLHCLVDFLKLIFVLPSVFANACCWHSFRTWCWLEKSNLKFDFIKLVDVLFIYLFI